MDKSTYRSDTSLPESPHDSASISCRSADAIFEAFESRWDAGGCPEIRSFLSMYSGPDVHAVARELVQIDMERRWRSPAPIRKPELPEYLDQLGFVLAPAAMIELVGWEFFVRNTWGDCVPRNAILLRHPELEPELADTIDAVSRQVAWPIVEVTRDSRLILSTIVDRPLEIGRQSDADLRPWTIQTSNVRHRLVLCPAGEPSLSRNQLEISLSAPGIARLQNMSSRRALALSGQDVIDAGCFAIVAIPVRIHLGGTLLLNLYTV